MQKSTNTLQQNLLDKSQSYKSKLQISIIAWSFAMSLFHFGYNLIYITQIPTATLKQIFNIDLQNGLTEGILNGCIPIGGLFGALISSFFIVKNSRRTNILIANIFCFVVGCLIYIQNFPVLIFCRLCQGVAIGFLASVTPLMVRQLSPNEIAGAIGTYTQLNICIGVIIGCVAPYGMLKVTGDQTAKDYWYLVFGIPQIIIVIQTVLIAFVFPYETPKYLLTVGKEQEARKLIEIIYKPEYVEQILAEKKLDIQAQQQKKMGTKTSQGVQNKKKKSSFFTIPTMMAIHVAVLQQFSGILIVAIYAQKISQSVASGELSLILPTIINFVKLMATLFSFFLLNRVGRRTILIYGSMIGGIMNAIIMVGYFIKDNSQFGQALLITSMLIFIVSYGFTIGPIGWIYIPEILDPSMIPYSTTATWLGASIVMVLFPILTEDYLNGNPSVSFIFSTIWCLGSAVINYFFALETKGKTQKDIRQQYQSFKLCERKVQRNNRSIVLDSV